MEAGIQVRVGALVETQGVDALVEAGIKIR